MPESRADSIDRIHRIDRFRTQLNAGHQTISQVNLAEFDNAWLVSTATTYLPHINDQSAKPKMAAGFAAAIDSHRRGSSHEVNR